MLTRMVMKFNGVAESKSGYDEIDDYEHEHRYAEHEVKANTTACSRLL